MFPDADVKATRLQTRPVRVKISAEGRELVDVAQRDLFAKYNWPAEEVITEALTKYKAETEGAEIAK